MADRSRIEWTDATWNPLGGCSMVSPGCTHCYAMKEAHRLAGNPNPKIAAKYAGTTRVGANGPLWTGNVNLSPADLDAPLRRRKPTRYFVNSMSDLFHEAVPDEFIDQVFAMMAQAHWHTFQVLTKRAARLPRYFLDRNPHLAMTRCFRNFREYDSPVGPWPLPNVWLGVSAEDQARADERIPHLLRVPAAVRFLSCEPLLGEINLCDCGSHITPVGWHREACRLRRLSWVIVGGESGPRARPMHPYWAMSIRDQCQAVGVPFFFKQWGEWKSIHDCAQIALAIDRGEYRFGEWHGTAPFEDGCICGSGHGTMVRVGKKAAGRHLDGLTWDQMPVVAPESRP